MTFEFLLPRCTACRTPLASQSAVVNHGDMVFHAACAPSCEVCGRHLGAHDAAWHCESEVVSESWGYSLRPTRLWCSHCWGTAPRDDPPAIG